MILCLLLLGVFCVGCDKLGFRIISESEYQELKSQQTGVRKPRYAEGHEGNPDLLEYHAWEEIEPGSTPGQRGTFKQVKKNYLMTSDICGNVVRVLNNPRSSNGSYFQCFPAHIDPNEYYRAHSASSDIPNK